MAIRKKSGTLNLIDFEKPLYCMQYSGIADALENELGVRYGEKILATMVYQIQTFMEDNFGRYSPQPRQMTKLPSCLFKDFSCNGPLHFILRSALNFKSQAKWDAFDILNPDVRQQGLSFLKQLEISLVKKNLLQRPIVYFSKVPEEIDASLRSIVLQHGGLLCGSPEFATHVIEWDDEVDTLPDDLTEEYVRTLELRPLESGGIALVHWFYYPDCYDEWIPSQDVDAVDPPDIVQLHSFASKESDFSDKLHQPWKVCCRFIRDCDTFNEWGNEHDYELVEDSDGMDEDESVPTTPDTGLGSSAHKTNRSPGTGRKAKKFDGSGGHAARRSAIVRKDIPVLESTTTCTDRMMQNAAPPSADRRRGKYSVVDIVSPVGGAPGSYPGSGITSQTYSLSQETCSSNVSSSGSRSRAENACDVVAESKEGENESAPPNKKRKADETPPALSVPSSIAHNKQSADTSRQTTVITQNSVVTTPSIPSWYQNDSISNMELRYLPCFFTEDFDIQTRETYLAQRTAIVNMYMQTPLVYLSATDCRRRLAGDACSLMKLHEFLDAFGIINTFVKPDHRPPLPQLALVTPQHFLAVSGSAAHPTTSQKSQPWTPALDRILVNLAYQSNGDWIEVSQQFSALQNLSISAENCLSRFVEFTADQLQSLVQQQSESNSNNNSSSSGTDIAICTDSTGNFVKLTQLQLRHLAGKSPASVSAKDLLLLQSRQASNSEIKLEIDVGIGKPVISTLAADSLNARLQTTASKLDDYLELRLQALEEKVELIAAARKEIEIEKQQLALERRDIQVQRALIASYGHR